jgi:transposase
MAALKISMYLLRQIIHQLCSEVAIKEIARNTKVSRNTIRGYRDKLQELGKTKEELQALAEPELFHLFCAPKLIEEDRKAIFLSLVDHWKKELKRKNVTRRIIWEEYIAQYPDGYSYSQFCFHLQECLKEAKVSMVGIHIAGERFFIDFAGDKLSYFDREKGVEVKCDVLLITLGYSNYTLAIALPNQKIDSVIKGSVDLFTRLGGVCKFIVPDNMKTAVVKSDPYEPVLNDSFLAMANHYKISVNPARPRKPQDKAKVEVSVNVLYRRVYARIRNRQFYSLEELNVALMQETDKMNNETMQSYGVSRKELFEQSEKDLLIPLPERPFELKKQYYLKVQNNGHVQISSLKQYFSVPYQFTGKQVVVIATAGLIHIYHEGVCIATHTSNPTVRYHTQRDHMPSSHQQYLDGMNPEKLIQRAEQISSEVGLVIKTVLEKQIYPEQAYKACNGILSLIKEVGKDILIKSCSQALEYNALSYMRIRAIAKNYSHTDVYDTKPTGALPQHENIRGRHQYN